MNPMINGTDNNGATDVIVPMIGVVVSILGILLESVADRQKSEQKKVRPHMEP